MKFFLSSFRLGNNPQQFANLFNNNKKVAIIVNAWDVYPDSDRRQIGIQREIVALQQIGLLPELLDLRIYFAKSVSLKEKLIEFGGVWVTGGNTFVLRRSFKESGFDQWLFEQKTNNNFVYGGYSAGVCVLSANLKNIELMDEPHVNPTGYRPGVIWEGLGLIDFAVVPHFQSDHPETESATKQDNYLTSNGIIHRVLRDGEVIIL